MIFGMVSLDRGPACACWGVGGGLDLTASHTFEHCLKHLWEGTHLVILVQKSLVTFVLPTL